MKVHRFIGNFNIAPGPITVQDAELFNQIRNVLKIKNGEEVILCDGNLNEGRAILKEFQKDSIIFEITEVSRNDKEPHREVTLFCAVLKKENFELVCQKATEIGVTQIIPIITERTLKLGLNSDRITKILREASEQSGRGRVPLFSEPVEFVQALDMASSLEANIFLSLQGSSFQKVPGQKIGLWVGPEGGWSPAEEDLAKERNFHVLSMGSRTFRGETAAIIGSYLAVGEE
jgi:16S rRNA (uracil1498-N3)-methyltransferase